MEKLDIILTKFYNIICNMYNSNIQKYYLTITKILSIKKNIIFNFFIKLI